MEHTETIKKQVKALLRDLTTRYGDGTTHTPTHITIQNGKICIDMKIMKRQDVGGGNYMMLPHYTQTEIDLD